MKTIYYFSGTGNSLWVAKQLKDKLQDTKLVSISKIVNNDKIEDKSSVIGFVFPIYMWNMPFIIRRFIEKLIVNKETYYFSVVTNAGSPGNTLNILNKMLKNKNVKLFSGFSITMPSNYIVFSGAEKDEKINKLTNMASKRISEIKNVILNRETSKLETSNLFINIIGSVVYKFSKSHVNKMDKNYWADDKCNGCKICEKICPVENIIMESDKPKWLGHCEQCMACIQYCPQESIQFGKKSGIKKRYQNPNIKISEMMK